MRLVSRFKSLVQSLFRKQTNDRELDDEVRFHMEMLAEEQIGQGMKCEEAWRSARLRFGGTEQVKERVREVRAGAWIETTLRDMRFGVRMLRRNPGVTIVAVLSLALAIGVNAGVLSIVNALFARDLPGVLSPGELVSVATVNPQRPEYDQPVLLSEFEEMRRRDTVFSDVFAWRDALPRNIAANGARYLGIVNEVSGNYFSALGAKPLLGRVLDPQDVASIGIGTSARVAVLDYRCWQEHFGSDPNVIGKTLWVDGTPLTVVGVMPKEFLGLDIETASDATVPIGFDTGQIADHSVPGVTSFNYFVAARLKPGIADTEANAYLQSIWPGVLQATIPRGYQGAQRANFLSTRVRLESLRTGDAGGNMGLRFQLARPLKELSGLSALVLIVACLNLAILILARTVGRRHELAIRAALGAGKWVLIRTLIVESVLVSAAGAALGLIAAFWLSRLLLMSLMAYEPLSLRAFTFDPRPDFRVLAIGVAVAIGIGIASALVPARRVMGSDPASAMQEGSRVSGGSGGMFQKALICSQVALALVLTLGAMLFGRSLYNLASVNPGFRIGGVLTMQLFPQVKLQAIPGRTAYYHEMLDRLSSIPGVDSVSYAQPGPLMGLDLLVPILSHEFANVVSSADLNLVGPGFFRVLGMKLVAGRDFEWSDDDHSSPVAVVSQSLAAQLFSGTNPIGQMIDVPNFPYGKGLRVVGVVNSASLWSLRSHETRSIYVDLMQAPPYNEFAVALHAKGDLSMIGAAADQAVASLGRQYSAQTQPLANRLKYVLGDERVMSGLAAFFAGLTILLASAGIYGLLSYAVTLRSPEIGIRVAMGAQRRDILLMVLKQAAQLVLLGIVCGMPVAIAGMRLASDILFGLTSHDPLTLFMSVAVLAIITLCAGYIPARRAMRLDPMAALRHE